MNLTLGLSRRGEYTEPVESELDGIVAPMQTLLGHLNATISSLSSDGAVFAVPQYGPVGVVANTGSRKLTAEESGTVVTNQGDADGSTVYLPSASAGLQFTFCLVASQAMSIVASSGDVINILGSTGTTLSASSAGLSASVVAVNTGLWVVTAYTGMWSVA